MEILQTRLADAGPDHSKSERAVIEARNAVQWLARVTRSYASTSGEDIRLSFDPASRRVMTPEIAPGTRLGLHLPCMVFQFEEDGKPTPHALELEDKSTPAVEAWLLAELLHRGFDRDRFDKRLPYKWPHPMSGDEIKYSPRDLAHELDQLTQKLATAATCLIEVRTDLEPDRDDQASVTFSPRSFSLGVAVASDGKALEVVCEWHDGVEGAVYRVADIAGRTHDAEIAASGEAQSNESVTRAIVEAIRRIENETSKRRD